MRLRTVHTCSDVSKATTQGGTPGGTPGVAFFAREVSGKTAGQAQQETQQQGENEPETQVPIASPRVGGGQDRRRAHILLQLGDRG